MSEERTADRPSYLCAAYGCPMLGTMSSGTGGGEFMCHVHYRRPASLLQSITVEVNFHQWLAHAIRDIRARSHNPDWRKTYERIQNDLAQSERTDLTHKRESVDQWMVRLEAELSAHVKVMLDKMNEQQPLEMETA